MGIKDLFISSDEPREEQRRVVEEKPKVGWDPSKTTTKFPETTTFPNFEQADTTLAPKQALAECGGRVEEIITWYKNGWASGNKPGIDFYEFHNEVVKTDDSEAVYKVLFSAYKNLNNALTPETLINDANEYIALITKEYQKYITEGEDKKKEILQQKETDKSTLGYEVAELETKVRELQKVINEKKTELSEIDSKFQPVLADIDCKLEANHIAKDTILTSIQNVSNGIKKFLLNKN